MLRHVRNLPPVSARGTAAPGVVDLWCFFYESVNDAALLAAYDRLMTPGERERHRRFVFEKDRRLFLATRALVRTVLSEYAAVRPEEWSFGEGSHGKPFVAIRTEPTALYFNLSNTLGLVACGVTRVHPLVGVDVEYEERASETITVADQFFSITETRELFAQPLSEQRERFFSYWTLKESYIKARGLGLALPLDQFSFSFDRQSIHITFGPAIADEPTNWQFDLLRASPRHQLAVGVHTGGVALSLRAACFVPLCGVVPFP